MLNVLWKMCGIDVHMDPNIGKRLNALGNTLTSLTGEEDNDDITDHNSVNMADLSDEDECDISPPIHTVRAHTLYATFLDVSVKSFVAIFNLHCLFLWFLVFLYMYINVIFMFRAGDVSLCSFVLCLCSGVCLFVLNWPMFAVS